MSRARRFGADLSPLPPFWHAAARLSGRIDLRPLFGSGLRLQRLADLPDVHRARLSARHRVLLRDGVALEQPGPFITIADPRYPAPLANIPRPPPVLFLRGDAGLLSRSSVAVVGTRRCTEPGARMARLIGRALARAGVVVTSGLAHGVDVAAHEAADGLTVAVLGQGLGRPLGGQRGRVARALLDAGGLLVSEFPPDVGANRFTFPQRNRVIAGLSRATVVVEAGIRSGALITARQALEQGKDVLAVPGHPLVDSAAGCLRLIRDGAQMITSVDELLEELGLPAVRSSAVADPLLEAIGDGSSFDVIVARTHRDPLDLARALAALELTGLVQRLPGDRYARRR